MQLRDEIASRIHQHDCKIVTKLYVDVEGLLASHRLPRTWSESSLRKFFVGFTQVQSAFDVVDTGPGREEVANKMKGKGITRSSAFHQLTCETPRNVGVGRQQCPMQAHLLRLCTRPSLALYSRQLSIQFHLEILHHPDQVKAFQRSRYSFTLRNHRTPIAI